MAMKTAGGNSAFHNFHNDYAHIADPNERRRLALAEIDKAPFGWYHVRAVVVAGIGFFTDAYDIFAIGLVTNMLGVVYFHNASKPGAIDSNADTAIKVRFTRGRIWRKKRMQKWDEIEKLTLDRSLLPEEQFSVKWALELWQISSDERGCMDWS